MALINCPSCKNDVSEQAPNCPKCGHPIADKEQQPQVTQPVIQPKKGKFGGCIKGILIVLGVFFVLIVVIALFSDTKPNETANTPTSISKPNETANTPTSISKPNETANAPTSISKPNETANAPTSISKPNETANAPTSISKPNETANAPTSISKTTVEIRPEAQIEFEKIISDYSNQFSKASNELQESETKRQRKTALSGLNLDINDWVGTIGIMATNTEGKAYISIKLDKNITIMTYNNALSDIAYKTLIEPDTELYNKLMNLSKGQKVKFSGQLFKSDDDFFEEISLTIKGSMVKPEFLILFSDITPIS